MLSKYQPLVDHLIAQVDAAETALTFDQIEAILGVPLPEAMRNDGGMWLRPHHAYVRAWEAAGWTAALDRRNRCVRFTRDAGGVTR